MTERTPSDPDATSLEKGRVRAPASGPSPDPTAQTERPPSQAARALTVAEAGAREWIGRIIDDRYRIVELLGTGGMGAVYVAEHRKLRKLVALKVIHPEFSSDTELAARFAREAMATAQVDHPHIASAVDYGTLPGGDAYLVMQLVRGKSLREMLDLHGRASWLKACEVGAQVADALSAAHAAGIVHRDLKPDNILLEPRDDGSELVKVLDFGIARVSVEDRSVPPEAAPRQALTRVGTIMGTPGYMAPEQALGESVDGRADLYSLGVIMWEMIAGARLFGDEEVTKLFARQLTETPPSLRSISGDTSVPAQLEDLVAQLLSRSPAERPERASVVRDGLRQVALSAALAAGPQSGQYSLPTASAAIPSISAVPPLVVPKHAQPVPTVRGPSPMSVALERGAAVARRTISVARLSLEKVRDRTKVPIPLLIAALVLPLVLLVTLVAVVAALGSDEKDTIASKPVAIAPPTKAPEGPLEGLWPFGHGRDEEEEPARPALPPEVQEDIDQMLHSDRRNSRRGAARHVFNYRPEEAIPPYARLVAELELSRGCRGKRPVVARLGQLGDPRALPALERLDQSRSGCGGFFGLGSGDCYECLRDMLPQVMQSLRSGQAYEGSEEEEE